MNETEVDVEVRDKDGTRRHPGSHVVDLRVLVERACDLGIPCDEPGGFQLSHTTVTVGAQPDDGDIRNVAFSLEDGSFVHATLPRDFTHAFLGVL